MDVKKEAAVKDFMRRCGKEQACLKLKKKEKDLTEEEITQCENELAESVINYVKKDAGPKVTRLSFKSSDFSEFSEFNLRHWWYWISDL